MMLNDRNTQAKAEGTDRRQELSLISGETVSVEPSIWRYRHDPATDLWIGAKVDGRDVLEARGHQGIWRDRGDRAGEDRYGREG